MDWLKLGASQSSAKEKTKPGYKWMSFNLKTRGVKRRETNRSNSRVFWFLFTYAHLFKPFIVVVVQVAWHLGIQVERIPLFACLGIQVFQALLLSGVLARGAEVGAELGAIYKLRAVVDFVLYS